MLSTKYGLLAVMVFYITFISYVANTVELAYLSGIDSDFVMPDNAIDSAFSMLGSIGRLMTFRLYGIPPVLNLLMFTPIMFAIGYMVIDWIRGN